MYVALLILTVVVYALVCAVYLRHRAASWFHPLTIYLGFHGIVFVLRPIMSWYYGYTFIYQLYRFSPDDYAKAKTLVVVNLGLISFAFASLYWGDARMTFRSDRGARRELSAMAWPLWLVSVPLMGVAAYSLYEIWSLRASADASLELDRATGIAINSGGGNGYAQFAFVLLVTLLPLLAWVGRFRPRWLAVVAAAALLMGGSGIRGPIISMLVCLASLNLYARGRRAPDGRLVLTVAAGVLAFVAIGADRGQQLRTLLTGERAAVTTTQVTAQVAPLEGMDLGNLEFVEFLVDKVPRDTRSYEYFLDNLQVFTEPIPRAWWHDKPIGQPIRLFYLFDYGFPIGMTRSLPGEGWTQFGLIGVVLWCAGWGAVCGAIYNRFAQGSQTPVRVASYAAFLATLIVFYRDGLLVTLLRQGVFFIVPPLLWWVAARAMGIGQAADLRLDAALPPRSQRRRRDPDRGSAIADAANTAAHEPAADGASGDAAGLMDQGTPDRALPRSRRHPRVAARRHLRGASAPLRG